MTSRNTRSPLEASPGARSREKSDELARLYESITDGGEFIRQVIATSLDCVKVLDLNGKLLFLNESGRKLLEISDLSTVLHTPWADWWEGEYRVAVEKAVANAKAGDTTRFEAFARTHGGTPKWWDVTVSPIRGADGKPEQLLSVSRDITERKRGEENLRTSEEQLRAAFDQSIMGMALTDLNGVILKANEAFLRIVDHPAEEVLGRTSAHMTHPEDQANNMTAIRSLQSGKRNSVNFHKRYLRKDGGVVWTQISISRVRGPDDEPGTLMATVEDITEQKRAQDALLESEQHLRLILESAKDYAIFTTDPAGMVMSWNAGAERTFGYAASQIVGRDAAVLWTPEDQARGGPAEEKEIASRAGVAEDKRWHQRKDGSRFFASGMLRPMYDHAGTLRGFTKVCRDVTAEREAEEELAKARAQIATSLEAERVRL
ncbi:MAG: PAS domain S-box protein, partial [Acidobacteriaceae bacterium]|nr:PAS domain S-box protein [Acidobacteriaceae bacterium]